MRLVISLLPIVKKEENVLCLHHVSYFTFCARVKDFFLLLQGIQLQILIADTNYRYKSITLHILIAFPYVNAYLQWSLKRVRVTKCMKKRNKTSKQCMLHERAGCWVIVEWSRVSGDTSLFRHLLEQNPQSVTYHGQ